ncbi:MAG: CobW family GTP-binding protein, partial [Gammaproteobacteria bacterium]
MVTAQAATVQTSVPLTTIGGFLGAGKTTLLNRVLSHSTGVRYAVLVNDFGDLAIDGTLISEHGGDTVTFANGCVCCTLGDNLLRAVDRLLDATSPPQHFLVEASGVADPKGIADLATLHPGLRRDLTIVLVDAETVLERAADPRLHDTVERQLDAADLLVLNKCDRVCDNALEAVEAWLAARTPAPTVRAQEARLPLEVLQDPDMQRAAGPKPVAHAPHEPGQTFASVTLTLDKPIDESRLVAALRSLPASVLRAKGFFTTRDRPGSIRHVELCGRRLD